MLLCLTVSVLLKALTIIEACDFSVYGCWMLKRWLRTYLFQVLNFILNFVRRKSAVSSFQDVMKLFCDSFVELNRINCFLAKLDASSQMKLLNFCCVYR